MKNSNFEILKKMKKTYKLALLSGPLFSTNMGCNALTYGSLNILSEIAARLNVRFEYYLIGNPVNGIIPDDLRSYPVTFIEQLPDFSPMGLLRGVYKRNLKQRKTEAGLLKKVDVYFDNAWGDSFSDIYGRARFETVLQHFNFAFRQNKPLILLPQTIGPFKSEDVRKKAGQVLKKADVVYARDPLSLQCAKQLVPELELFETIDVAMFMPFQKKQKFPAGLTAGINPSGLLWKGGYTGTNQFGLQDDYKTIIRNIIKHLLSEHISIELIGHAINGPNAGNTGDDYYVCKLLQKEFPQCHVAPFFYSPTEAKSYISALDMLIGSRMHCCIAAYSSGVPVFPLAYSRKFKGLFSDKLGYNHLSDLADQDLQTVLAGLKSFLEQNQKIKTHLFENSPQIDKSKNELIEHLANKLAKHLK